MNSGTAEKDGEAAVFLRASDELREWSPERDSRAIGNLVRTAVSSEPSEVKDAGLIVPTKPEASTALQAATPIPLTWSDQEGTRLNPSAINTVKGRERRLAADGDIRSFYNDIRASVMGLSGGRNR